MASAKDTSRRGGSRLHVFHHFFEGAERVASEALLDEFQRRHDVSVEEKLANISDLRLQVKSQILQENPPDVWDEWPGMNLRPAYEAGVTADVTDVWETEGFESAFTGEAVAVSRFDGTFHCVPLDMYRTNTLFFNREVTEKLGISPDHIGGAAEFAEVLEQIDGETESAPCIVHMRDPFGLLQLWEAVVLDVGGPSTHEALRNGAGRANRDTIRRTFEILQRYLAHTPEEAVFMSSKEADIAFSDGEAAFLNNGTWGIGQYANADDFEFGEQWEHVPFPGTDEHFLVNMNAFVPSSMADNPTATESFLSYVGSRDALRAFNREVGSLPPRTDIDLSEFHPLTQRMGRDLEECRSEVPSVTHGIGVSPNTLIDLKAAAGSFVSTRDVDEVTSEFVAAFESNE